MSMRFIFLISILLSATVSNAQVGIANMKRMNTLLKIHGGSNNSQLSYESRSGFIEQKILNYTDHFTISEIKRIIVRDNSEGSTVELACDTADVCISHIDPSNKSKMIGAVYYTFNTNNAANEFAQLADEIIRKDFGKKPYLVLTIDPSGGVGGGMQQMDDQEDDEEDVVQEKQKKKEVVAVPKKEVDHLSVGSYEDTKSDDYIQSLSEFGKKVHSIRNIAEKGVLASLRGAEEMDGVYAAKIKLPKAKKSYISTFKGADCYVAEFGTKKYYEDLEELYYDLKDEIEEALPTDYEAIDMANEKIYEDSDDEVFHTEFYSSEDSNKPSIVLRITPDGKKNTLFLRVGKK